LLNFGPDHLVINSGWLKVEQAGENDRGKEASQDYQVLQETMMRVRAQDVVDLTAKPMLDAPPYVFVSHSDYLEEKCFLSH